MTEDFEELDDDQLYDNYEAYKALIEAGVSKKDALKKTGLTAQIVKDFEDEEKELGEDDEYKSEFKEVWGADDEDFDEGDWKETSLDDDDSWGEEADFDDGYGEDDGGYDEKDY